MSDQGTTIMVVEDETLLLQAITKKFKLSGLDVISCASGQQAIDYLSNIDEMPDAISLDYYLKDMNGLAFLQTIKENPKWKNIPVIVLSNSASPQKVHNMLALGANKYLLKAEYRLDEVIAMILQIIEDVKKNAGTGASPNPDAPPPAAPPTDPPTADPPPTDDDTTTNPPPATT